MSMLQEYLREPSCVPDVENLSFHPEKEEPSLASRSIQHFLGKETRKVETQAVPKKCEPNFFCNVAALIGNELIDMYEMINMCQITIAKDLQRCN